MFYAFENKYTTNSGEASTSDNESESNGELGGGTHEDVHHHNPLINVRPVALQSLLGC
jgi:hypothetical protein